MFNFIKNLFTLTPEEPVYTPVKGDIYFLNTDDSPWVNDLIPITILDCKEGWVRYYIGSKNPPFNDCCMRQKAFLAIYIKQP